jgi:hypothetical protein
LHTVSDGLLVIQIQSEVSKKMGTMTIVAIAVCAIGGMFLYVMGLCYLCDFYALQKEKQKREEEKKRKETLRLAYEHAEKKRKEEVKRRKQMARKRRERGIVSANLISKKNSGHAPASAARA